MVFLECSYFGQGVQKTYPTCLFLISTEMVSDMYTTDIILTNKHCKYVLYFF